MLNQWWKDSHFEGKVQKCTIMAICEDDVAFELDEATFKWVDFIKYLGFKINTNGHLSGQLTMMLDKGRGLLNMYQTAFDSKDLNASVKVYIMRTLVNVLRFREKLPTQEMSHNVDALENGILTRVLKQHRENHPRNDVLRALNSTKQIPTNSEVARLIEKVRIVCRDGSLCVDFLNAPR